MTVSEGDQADTTPGPEWCLIATMREYPYGPNGSHAAFRSHGRFPAGAKLYVVGGFAGMGYETVTVVGYGHHRRAPITVHLPARFLCDWRVALVYRPAILRALRAAVDREASADRWNWDGLAFDSDAYRDRLTATATGFESWLGESAESAPAPVTSESAAVASESATAQSNSRGSAEISAGFVRRWLRRLRGR
ncbi:hypothetical protein ACFXHA_40165 [Nocardia sp. NPDC059240]|uniref:hypothetical protein n=1 Tax=Nocardia sp. NPDC059240 TaxID=3346786 RepID=UPI00367439D9